MSHPAPSQPVHLTKASSLQTSGGQTEGMIRQNAIVDRCDGICASSMLAKAHSASAVHHHGAQDTVVYAVRGRGAVVSEGGRKRVDLEPGDFCLIPAYMEHQEVNDSDDDVLWTIVRSGRTPDVVNLTGWDGEPVKEDSEQQKNRTNTISATVLQLLDMISEGDALFIDVNDIQKAETRLPSAQKLAAADSVAYRCVIAPYGIERERDFLGWPKLLENVDVSAFFEPLHEKVDSISSCCPALTNVLLRGYSARARCRKLESLYLVSQVAFIDDSRVLHHKLTHKYAHPSGNRCFVGPAIVKEDATLLLNFLKSQPELKNVTIDWSESYRIAGSSDVCPLIVDYLLCQSGFEYLDLDFDCAEGFPPPLPGRILVASQTIQFMRLRWPPMDILRDLGLFRELRVLHLVLRIKPHGGLAFLRSCAQLTELRLNLHFDEVTHGLGWRSFDADDFDDICQLELLEVLDLAPANRSRKKLVELDMKPLELKAGLWKIRGLKELRFNFNNVFAPNILAHLGVILPNLQILHFSNNFDISEVTSLAVPDHSTLPRVKILRLSRLQLSMLDLTEELSSGLDAVFEDLYPSLSGQATDKSSTMLALLIFMHAPDLEAPVAELGRHNDHDWFAEVRTLMETILRRERRTDGLREKRQEKLLALIGT